MALQSASKNKSASNGIAELDAEAVDSLTERSIIPAVDYDLDTTVTDMDQDSGFSSPRQTFNNNNHPSPSSTERLKLPESELTQERNENTIIRERCAH